MDGKKVSIIIPVYNAEKCIEKCVESIIENKYGNIEIILIDDGSKDSSWSVCEKLGNKYENIICEKNEENRGVSATRNRGLDLASGQLVLFIDSDDWVESDYVDTFVRAETINTSDMYISGYLNHDEVHSGRTDIFAWRDFQGTREQKIKDCLMELYNQRLLQMLWNKLFKLDIIRQAKIRFDESISIGEDFKFLLEYLSNVKHDTIVQINKATYHYMRDRKDSLMLNFTERSVEVPLGNLKTMYQLLEYSENEIEKKINEERIRQLELYAYFLMHNENLNLREKKSRIIQMSAQGKSVYKRNRNIYIKELIAKKIKVKLFK